MTDKTIHSIIEILDKSYPVRCQESELESLHQAAAYLNQKIQAVKESGKIVNPERIIIVTSLNITHELLQSNRQKTSLVNRIQQRIGQLQDKLDSAIHPNRPSSDLIYTTD